MKCSDSTNNMLLHQQYLKPVQVLKSAAPCTEGLQEAWKQKLTSLESSSKRMSDGDSRTFAKVEAFFGG